MSASRSLGFYVYSAHSGVALRDLSAIRDAQRASQHHEAVEEACRLQTLRPFGFWRPTRRARLMRPTPVVVLFPFGPAPMPDCNSPCSSSGP
jgi:hypothetical protein